MSECILWSGNISKTGYGKMKLDGRPCLAHRVAFCNRAGISLDDIKGMVVRHTCDVRNCVNPDHLLLGTQADNVQDRVDRNRGADVSGTKNPNCKVTAQDIEEIRDMILMGYKHKVIAEKFNLSRGYISMVKHRRSWGD